MNFAGGTSLLQFMKGSPSGTIELRLGYARRSMLEMLAYGKRDEELCRLVEALRKLACEQSKTEFNAGSSPADSK